MGLARAELIADRGAGAASDELFRSPGFLAAEGATHTLRIERDEWSAAVPLIVREIEVEGDGPAGTAAKLATAAGEARGGLSDAVSPYAYPGATITGPGEPPAASEIDWSETGLVSVFARERVSGPAWLAAPKERSRLLIHDPGRERRVRPRLREQVAANERRGWTCERVSGPESAASARARFAGIYRETMIRTGAAERYFFADSYFDAVLGFERSWLLTASRDGLPGSAAIAAVSDGVLHYFLGGTAEAALADSPFKNVVVAMLDLADEVGMPLNLGGGVTPGDGLERFKRGFANAEVPFRTHEVVCDTEAYTRLSGDREAGAFFPAYRAGP